MLVGVPDYPYKHNKREGKGAGGGQGFALDLAWKLLEGHNCHTANAAGVRACDKPLSLRRHFSLSVRACRCLTDMSTKNFDKRFNEHTTFHCNPTNLY